MTQPSLARKLAPNLAEESRIDGVDIPIDRHALGYWADSILVSAQADTCGDDKCKSISKLLSFTQRYEDLTCTAAARRLPSAEGTHVDLDTWACKRAHLAAFEHQWRMQKMTRWATRDPSMPRNAFFEPATSGD